MQHILFLPNPNNEYKVAILIKKTSFNRTEMLTNYVVPLEKSGLPQSDIIAFDLDYNAKKKAPVKLIKECLNTTLKALDSLGVKTILCCDGNYFKVLANKRKSEPHYGYVLPVVLKGFEHMSVIICANHSALMHDPSFQPKIDMGVKTLANYIKGSHVPPGAGIIKHEHYPDTDYDVKSSLLGLLKHPKLTCDIETYGLQHDTCGLGSIAFAWNHHCGVAFTIDYEDKTGVQKNNPNRKRLLKEFFEMYTGKLVYHRATFDIKILIYQLWMNDLLDQQGMLTGLEVMTRSIDDTKIITFLATNSCAGNHLGLKENVHEFAGNYAQDDIKDISLIPRNDLLRYNLVDALSTFYLLDKNYPIMVESEQENVYKNIMIPTTKVVLQMELSGMPMDDAQINITRKELTAILDIYVDDLFNCPLITKFTNQLRKEEWIKKNLLLKVKVRPIEDFDYVMFNPNSNIQVAQLLYLVFGFDIIDKTDSGAPAVGAKTLKKLLLVSKDTEHTTILNCLIGISEVSIILNTFVNAMEKGVMKADGMRYLHGNFNINGTKSGRLSSSKPNLTNIPSTGSVYAKHIKKCFQAPKGHIMVGADFNSLEAMISALTTKDPNKLLVYEQGMDSHSFNAFSYWPEKFPDIVNTVESINTIKRDFPEIRQDSKPCTFLLTYAGSYHGLMHNIGFSEEEAKKIEDNYHNLYKASDEWVAAKLQEASKVGYVVGAFGLRLRTPVLKKTILGNKITPAKAKAESRTAGNMLGQSYGILNSRAAIEFQERVLASKYRLDIKPCALVHDAIYLIVKDTVGCVEWVNTNLIECMEWDNLPELQHPTVKLGASMEIFYPSWKDSIELPNNASKREILKAVKENKK